MDEAKTQYGPGKAGMGGRLPALILLLPSLLLGILWLLGQLDPALMGTILAGIDWLATRFWGILLALVLPAVLVILVVYPPAGPRIRLWMEGNRRRMAFDRQKARDLLQRLAEFESVRDLQALGELYVDGGQAALAVQPLAKSIELEPGSARSHYLLARALQDLGQPREAYAAAHQALRLDQTVAFGEAWLLIGELSLKLDIDEDALVAAEKHEKNFGTSVRGAYLAARAHHRLGQREERDAALERVLSLEPGRGKTYSPDESLARARARLVRRTGGHP